MREKNVDWVPHGAIFNAWVFKLLSKFFSFPPNLISRIYEGLKLVASNIKKKVRRKIGGRLAESLTSWWNGESLELITWQHEHDIKVLKKQNSTRHNFPLLRIKTIHMEDSDETINVDDSHTLPCLLVCCLLL